MVTGSRRPKPHSMAMPNEPTWPADDASAVGKVDKAEIQIRLRRQGKCAKRGKIRGIATVTRHRHMDEIHRARTRLRNAVGIGDAGRKIGGLDNMFVTGSTVTQMNAHLDIHGHDAEKPGDPRGGGGQNVFIMQRHTAIGGDNFVTDIPLDGELVVGDTRRQWSELPAPAPLR